MEEEIDVLSYPKFSPPQFPRAKFSLHLCAGLKYSNINIADVIRYLTISYVDDCDFGQEYLPVAMIVIIDKILNEIKLFGNSHLYSLIIASLRDKKISILINHEIIQNKLILTQKFGESIFKIISAILQKV